MTGLIYYVGGVIAAFVLAAAMWIALVASGMYFAGVPVAVPLLIETGAEFAVYLVGAMLIIDLAMRLRVFRRYGVVRFGATQDTSVSMSMRGLSPEVARRFAEKLSGVREIQTEQTDTGTTVSIVRRAPLTLGEHVSITLSRSTGVAHIRSRPRMSSPFAVFDAGRNLENVEALRAELMTV